MAHNHAFLRSMRTLHLYLGVFISPALIFFAFTGALQSFSFHETTPGSSYKPPAWIASLAQLHKKQTTEVPVRRPRPDGVQAERPKMKATPAPEQQSASAQQVTAPRPKQHLPMKIFFLLVSVGLFLSTLTGIYMAYRYTRNRLVISGLLLAGIILPLLLLPF